MSLSWAKRKSPYLPNVELVRPLLHPPLLHPKQAAIVDEKLRRRRPALYIKPAIRDIRVMEFYRAEEIYRQAAPARDELCRHLIRLVGQPA